jgi:predicted adenylyl cyclase CyaB
MFEVELKAKIDKKSENAIHNKLRSLKPYKIEDVVYEDAYFDTEDRKLSDSGKELRIRKVLSDRHKVILTYKDKPFHGESRSKPEYEVAVDNYENIVKILRMLGYTEDIKISKKCTNYSLKYKSHDVMVTIAEIPEIGSSFIELEIQVDSITKANDAMRNLHDITKYLDIPESSLTSEYYTEMMRKIQSKKAE